VARLISAVPAGSYVTISHAASDISPVEMAEMIRRMNEHLAEGNHVGRPREVVARFFGGLELLPPGVVKVTGWRPASQAEANEPTSLWAASGERPESSRPGSVLTQSAGDRYRRPGRAERVHRAMLARIGPASTGRA